MEELKSDLKIAPEISQAKQMGLPIVALESTVITHGLPWPENYQLALEMEQVICKEGAIPATIALLQGQVHIGLNREQLEHLAQNETARKISLRDFGIALAGKLDGGTTVAATMFAAEKAGIKIFATGGIGGVHRQSIFDISADLPQLSRCPVVVVCAGAKSILNLEATLEFLETWGVPVIGYQTDSFPAFFASNSGLPVDIRAESAEEVAEIARAHWGVGLKSGLLVANPAPAESALDYDNIEVSIQKALDEAQSEGVRGNKITPYLLSKISQLSDGDSMKANLALLLNNAKLAANIAQHLVDKPENVFSL